MLILFFFAIKTSYIMKGGLNMTRKQIDASREARLWIGQVIVPAVTGVGVILSMPGVKEKVAEKCRDIKRKFKKNKTR